jgi:hypothetical protein
MLYVAIPTIAPAADRAQREASIRGFFRAIETGDYAALEAALTPNAVTRWPQSRERITGAAACVRVFRDYPGGSPKYAIKRISGEGDAWVAELEADYGGQRWHLVSLVEFDGARIARLTDYFGQDFDAPDWRRGLVEHEPAD